MVPICPGSPDEHEEDQQHGDDLQRHADDTAQGGELAAIDARAPQQAINRAVREQQQQQRHEHDGATDQQLAQHRALLVRHHAIPLTVDVRELLARADALIAHHQTALVDSDPAREAEKGVGGGRRGRRDAAGVDGGGGWGGGRGRGCRGRSRGGERGAVRRLAVEICKALLDARELIADLLTLGDEFGGARGSFVTRLFQRRALRV